jgi:hypothetical protein
MVVNMGAQELMPVKQVKNPTVALRLRQMASDLNRRLVSRMPPELMVEGLRDDVDIPAAWEILKKHVHGCGRDAVPEDRGPAPHCGITEATLKLVRDRARLRKEMLSYAGERGQAGRTVREKLNVLRTAVKRAVRRDKNAHLEEMAADVERNFERSGSLRKAYLGIKRLAGQSRHAVADLQSVKVDDFQEHFRQLLGAGGTTIPDEIQATRAWRLAHKWLADKSKYEPPWDVSAEPPTWVEFGEGCESCRDDKGFSGDMMPTELWKHSEAARDPLWKLVVRVWEAMKVKISMPEDWLTASLVCLYKGKGDRGNPAMYRGISLISGVEKILGLVTLKRIGVWADRRLNQAQNSFRPKKSCRNAVFKMWRKLEAWEKEGKSYNVMFIDFSKAFDSLACDRMWEMLKFAGCPAGLVTVIRAMYEHAAVALRVNTAGRRTPPFRQKNGIRQGSSLSPLIFVLVLDFCKRVTEAAMAEEGHEDRPDPWEAYADDIADETVGEMAEVEEEASAALQQLQGAAAVSGLLVNVDKTMAHRVKLPETAEKGAWMERFEVKLENGDELVLVEVGKVGYAQDAKYKEDPANQGRRSADSKQ